MTKQEADDILGYVAQNLLSPMAFDGRPTSETWEIMIGTPFHNLCRYVYEKVDKSTKSDIIHSESEVNKMETEKKTPRQVCELFFELFNQYGYDNIKKVFESAEQMYLELKGDAK